MTKDQVIQRFCELSSTVGSKAFDNRRSHDCFCTKNNLPHMQFCFEEEIIQFIEEAVVEKLARDK